tara:strand:+ start:5354 stop:5470 length:117 start_codon:yes stop_codon:yes gene_type:complete
VIRFISILYLLENIIIIVGGREVKPSFIPNRYPVPSPT